MKDLKIIAILLILLALSLLIKQKQANNLKAGDIAFIGFNASQNDGFSIITLANIKPNSTIYFTDSEWNGTRFGADESNMSWNSGNTLITKGTIIIFDNISKHPKVNLGTVKNTMKLSKNGDALFAYLGSAPKLPSKFLAAVATNSSSYGTLANTGLIEGFTAITYPKGTFFSELNDTIFYTDKGFLLALNNMNNYKLETTSNYLKESLANNQ